jgi:hypothetical protein
MPKKYIAPRVEVIEINVEGCLAMSTGTIPVDPVPGIPAARQGSWDGWEYDIW